MCRVLHFEWLFPCDRFFLVFIFSGKNQLYAGTAIEVLFKLNNNADNTYLIIALATRLIFLYTKA